MSLDLNQSVRQDRIASEQVIKNAHDTITHTRNLMEQLKKSRAVNLLALKQANGDTKDNQVLINKIETSLDESADIIIQSEAFITQQEMAVVEAHRIIKEGEELLRNRNR